MSWIKISDNTWKYEDAGVRFFLLAGTEYALLIDSGMQVHTAKELAQELTDLPISLFNTHTDPDHIGSNEEFENIMLNPAELVNYRKSPTSQQIIPIYDGEVIDLGNRTLEAIHLPGHTPGSTALLDTESGMLFSGDPVQDGKIFMFGPMRNLPAYIHSLKRLQKYSDRITSIYPCHGSCPIEPSIIPKLIAGAEKVESNEADFTLTEIFGQKVREYDIGVAILLRDDN